MVFTERMSTAEAVGTGVRRLDVARRPRWAWIRAGLAVAIISVGIVAAVDRRHQLTNAARHLGHLRAEWVFVALVAEAASMLAFARLQQLLLRSGGSDVAFGPMAGITLSSNAMAMSLPGGAA